MAKAMTKRQKEFLDYIKSFRAKKGYSPSYREIGKHFGLSSVATVASHIKSLEKKGLLMKNDREARSVLLPEEGGETAFALPMLGMVAAGSPLDTTAYQEKNETLTVPEVFVRKNKRSFVLQASGDSMQDMGIMDGDFIVVENREEPRNGETVVAGVGEEGDATVKTYKKEGGIVYLISQNEKYEPIRIDTKKTPLKIYGIVTGVIRKY